MFCLRQFTDNGANEYKNVPVATFEKCNSSVWRVKYEPPQINAKQVLYQVYPGEPDKTFYTLEKSLFVFCSTTNGDLQLAGQTAHADQYLYFEMQNGKHDGCVLVSASSLEEARNLAQTK